MKGYRNNFIRKTHNVSGFVYEEIDRLKGLVGSDARILIAPNHSDNADGLVLYRLAEEVDSMFCQMATRELFEGNFGFRHFIFPRCGIFPIDREGSVLGRSSLPRMSWCGSQSLSSSIQKGKSIIPMTD